MLNENNFIELKNDVNNSVILNNILQDIFKNYYMLQTVVIDGTNQGENITTLYFNDQMRVVDIHGIKIGNLSENIKNWNKVEYLRLESTLLQYMPDNLKILQDMKFLNLGLNLLNNVDVICELTNLKYLILKGNPLKSIPYCISDNTKLTSLEQLDITLLENGFSYSMLSRNLQELNAYGTPITLDLFPGKPKNIIYNKNTIYYLQQSELCELFQSDRDIIYDHNPSLFRFLITTNACDEYCNILNNTDVSHYQFLLCEPALWNNGVCNIGCNNEGCQFDGGDCAQLCDFEICTPDLIGNGYCDLECNNKNCMYDFGECKLENEEFKLSELVNGTNITEYEYEIAYCILNTKCKQNWINDGYCDSYCDNNICFNDAGDCDECSGDCQSFWEAFILISNSREPDYMIEIKELCNWWHLVSGSNPDYIKHNCSISFRYFDIDNNDRLNALEFHKLSHPTFSNTNIKPFQMDCSLCDNNNIYYKPWMPNDIDAFTTLNEWDKHFKKIDNQLNINNIQPTNYPTLEPTMNSFI